MTCHIKPLACNIMSASHHTYDMGYVYTYVCIYCINLTRLTGNRVNWMQPWPHSYMIYNHTSKKYNMQQGGKKHVTQLPADSESTVMVSVRIL